MVCAGFCSKARKCDLTHTSLFLFPFIALVSCCRPIRNPPGGHAAKLFLGGGPRLKRMIIMLNTNPNAIDLVPVWEDKQNQTPTDRGKWGTPPQRLSGYEETILIGESKIPVNVRTVNHFGAEEATDGRTMETFVSNLCSLVMRSFEFLRGRLSLAPLERICSYGCRKRLRVFAGLLGPPSWALPRWVSEVPRYICRLFPGLWRFTALHPGSTASPWASWWENRRFLPLKS